MDNTQLVRRLEEVARDLDLAVYRLERPPAAGVDLAALLRELEAVRDRVVGLAREADR